MSLYRVSSSPLVRLVQQRGASRPVGSEGLRYCFTEPHKNSLPSLLNHLVLDGLRTREELVTFILRFFHRSFSALCMKEAKDRISLPVFDWRLRFGTWNSSRKDCHRLSCDEIYIWCEVYISTDSPSHETLADKFPCSKYCAGLRPTLSPSLQRW